MPSEYIITINEKENIERQIRKIVREKTKNNIKNRKIDHDWYIMPYKG